MRPADHDDECPLAPAYVPDWAVGTVLQYDSKNGGHTGGPSATVVYHPAISCSLCGRPVWYADKTTRSRTKTATGRRWNVYCSPGCKADAPAAIRQRQIEAHRDEVFAAAAAAMKANADRPVCWNPHKRAYDTQAQAEVHNAAVLAMDSALRVYYCSGERGCGKFHLGHPRRDAGQSISAIARVVS